MKQLLGTFNMGGAADPCSLGPNKTCDMGKLRPRTATSIYRNLEFTYLESRGDIVSSIGLEEVTSTRQPRIWIE